MYALSFLGTAEAASRVITPIFLSKMVDTSDMRPFMGMQVGGTAYKTACPVGGAEEMFSAELGGTLPEVHIGPGRPGEEKAARECLDTVRGARKRLLLLVHPQENSSCRLYHETREDIGHRLVTKKSEIAEDGQGIRILESSKTGHLLMLMPGAELLVTAVRGPRLFTWRLKWYGPHLVCDTVGYKPFKEGSAEA